jgi:hypothetical protein
MLDDDEAVMLVCFGNLDFLDGIPGSYSNPIIGVTHYGSTRGYLSPGPVT